MSLDVNEYADDKPFLLIDVDGVINTINGSQNQKTYEIFKVWVYTIRIRHEMTEWLGRLADHYHLVWATMWDDDANRELSPRLGLPDLPYVPCWDSQDTVVEWNDHTLHTKIPSIEEHLKDRPFAFVDDSFSKGDLIWARWRDDQVAPTRFLPIDPRMGLLEHHVDKLIKWAQLIK